MKKLQFILFLVFLLIQEVAYSQQQDSVPIHDSFKIVSKIINEIRTINVWTPPQYSDLTKTFPVLYMPDGGINEDFPHIANTLAILIKEKRIPPVILVGIENTQRRRDLSGPTEIEQDKKIAPVVGGSEIFRTFIKEELFVEIKNKYRITGEKGIIGESLAGLFIVETLLLTPDLFDFYIAMDPSLWWNNHYLVRIAKNNLSKMPANEKRFWFASSKTKDISPFTNDLAKILESEKIKTIKWKYSNEPKEKHNTIYRATKEKALLWIFNSNEYK